MAQATQTFNSTATTETVTGLTNDTAYTFTVAAINSVGTGTRLGAVQLGATPTTPGGAHHRDRHRRERLGHGHLDGAGLQRRGTPSPATWSPPTSAGVAQATQTFNSTATTETVTGLTNGTTYTFTVAAINGVGTGRPVGGRPTRSPRPRRPAPRPAAPAPAATPRSSVSWTAPASNGGSAVTGYVVTPYIAGAAQATQTFNSTATTETVTGLTNGTAYTFTVAAINSVGTGAQSAASNSVTPATTPGAPTIGTATAGNASATVDLDGPGLQRRVGHHRLRGHPLHRRHGPGHPDLQLDGHHRDGHRPDQRHRPTPSRWPPSTASAPGPQSAPSNSVTPATVPGAPTIGTATAGNASATRDLDGPGLQRRLGHHRLRGHPLHRPAWPRPPRPSTRRPPPRRSPA